jgi:hypothetical protein
MSEEWELQICCMGAGYVGGPTMAVIAKQCPKVRALPLPLDLVCVPEQRGRFCRVVLLSDPSQCLLSVLAKLA